MKVFEGKIIDDLWAQRQDALYPWISSMCVLPDPKRIFMGKGPPPRPLPINILLGSGYAFDAYIHQGRGGGREGGISYATGKKFAGPMAHGVSGPHLCSLLMLHGDRYCYKL